MLSSADERLTGRHVWDPLVRIGHWLLVTSVIAAWFTRHGGGIWHEVIGYAALAVVAVRLVWGMTGTRYARFADFVRGPRGTLAYARQMWRGAEPRHLGHNPLGGWMIIALIITVIVITISGWLYTTDRFWGVAWVDMLHSKSTDVLFVLVALHVAGVLYSSWRHRENLVAAMLHGRKRPEAEPQPVMSGRVLTERSADEYRSA
ncbi:MAG TPA: cytochrome b/b6 domain-containing protein [Woeseiaceae bacterium]|nr:cytochrome b/b6 domain-containing protein [Woeseiaceae bacterium]